MYAISMLTSLVIIVLFTICSNYQIFVFYTISTNLGAMMLTNEFVCINLGRLCDNVQHSYAYQLPKYD